jgi:hypothetical protein
MTGAFYVTAFAVGTTLALLLLFSPFAKAEDDIIDISVEHIVCPAKGDPSRKVFYFNATKGQFGIRTEKLKFSDGMDVNEDGKKDQLLDSGMDLAGNKVETWCLQQSDKIDQRFGLAFVPAKGDNAGKRLWFAGCYFANAMNTTLYFGKVDMKSGNYKEYDEVVFNNRDYMADNDLKIPMGKNDYHFRYFNAGPNKGKIRKDNSTGKWVKNTEGIWEYKTEKVDEGDVVDPLKLPQDLRVASNVSPNGGVDVATAVVTTDVVVGPNWSYALQVNPSFTWGDDVLISPSVHINAGDQLTIAGAGITDPYVSGEAATPAFGGWQVLEYDSQHVTFVANYSVDVLPDRAFGSFGFHSDYPASGLVPWVYAGGEIGISSHTWGPGYPSP